MHTSTNSIQGNQHRLVYRVHDATSESCLTDQGFTATSTEFYYPISGKAWLNKYQGLHTVDSFVDNEHVLEGIAEHVLGGWPGYTTGYTGESAWISASMSFHWASWEVVRRLVVLQRESVEMTIISCKAYNKYYEGVQAVWLNAADAIQTLGEHVHLTRDQLRALAFSRASSEVVYLGKIFRKDIVQNTEWTLEVNPYKLRWGGGMKLIGQKLPKNLRFMGGDMEPFFRPKKQWVQGGDWVDQLVFSPKDSFKKASAKIQARKQQLAVSRGGYD
jgi:hypothetical protein